MKPVQYTRLAKSLDKMRDMHQAFGNNSPVIQVNEIMDMIRNGESKYKSRFMVKLGSKIKTIKTSEIAYFYSYNKLTLLVTKEGQQFPVDYALDELIHMLNPDLFFHINRKLIIHIDSAKEIHPYFKGRLKLILHPMLDEEIIISSQKTPLFKTWLDH
jgi:two-component system LytT family response regulator